MAIQAVKSESVPQTKAAVMHIAGIIDNQFYLSGVNAYWRSFAGCLNRLGHEVSTWVLDNGAVSWNGELHNAWPGTVVRLVYSEGGGDLVGRWKDELIGRVPDILLHHYSDIGLALSDRIGRRSSLRDVYICHADDPDHYRRIQRFRDRFDHLICVSDVCRQTVCQSIGIDTKQITLVEYAFDPPIPPARISDRFEVLYAGRLEQYQKRARDLVRLGLLLAAQDSVRLHIAGDGSELTALRQALAAETEHESIVFHGFLREADLFRLMRRCHAFVSLSEFEGLSTSLVQAMAHRLVPVITQTNSGIGFMRHGSNALLFEPGDLPACARQIGWLADNPDAFEKMAAAAYATFSAEFSRSRMQRQCNAFLKRACLS